MPGEGICRNVGMLMSVLAAGAFEHFLGLFRCRWPKRGHSIGGGWLGVANGQGLLESVHHGAIGCHGSRFVSFIPAIAEICGAAELTADRPLRHAYIHPAATESDRSRCSAAHTAA